MVFVCESRGLMVSTLLTENTYDLSVVAKKLFEYKNGDDAQQVKLGELKAAFHRFFPKLTPDIIFSPQKDENEKRGERLLKGYPVIIYRNENDSEVNHVSQSSAGMNDVLMLLAAIFIGEFSVIVLDEISRSLHSTLKHILSRTLQHSNLCVIAVTHDAELVSEATARNVIRFHKDNKRGTYQLPQIVEANDARDIDKTNFWKFVCDPLRLPVFFARGILFVEGESEVRFFNALTNLILKQKIVVPGVELQSFHFLWDVIPLGGAGSSKFAFKLMNDWKHLPHMFLLDWDNFVLSSKKEEMGENQPKKPRRLEWDQIDWSTRKNNALYNHGPACEMIKSDTKPDTWKRLHNAYASKFERIWVWPMDVFDIEGVCGLKKKQLSVKPFADLQDHIEGMLNGLVTVGRADALVAFINRLVNLHNNDE
jgi:energy-coupling factor transporter ATP-binding protein EcfA2